MLPFRALSWAIIASVWLLALTRHASADVVIHNPPEAPIAITSPTLGVVSLNLAHARGEALNQLLVSAKNHRHNLDAIAPLISSSRSQLVALQEADAPSLWSGSFNHVAYLAQHSGHISYAQDAHADSWLFSYGAALLTTAHIGESGSTRLPSGWFTPGKGLVRANVDWRPYADDTSVTITFVSTHFDFSSERLRRRQAAALVEDLRGLDNPLILAGDFNSQWAREDSVIRTICEDLDLRAYRPTAKGLGTYGDDVRLDWILISSDLDFLEYRVLEDRVSDHRAVQAIIELKKVDSL